MKRWKMTIWVGAALGLFWACTPDADSDDGSGSAGAMAGGSDEPGGMNGAGGAGGVFDLGGGPGIDCDGQADNGPPCNGCPSRDEGARWVGVHPGGDLHLWGVPMMRKVDLTGKDRSTR